jgi:hypothetical protein
MKHPPNAETRKLSELWKGTTASGFNQDLPIEKIGRDCTRPILKIKVEVQKEVEVDKRRGDLRYV